MNIKIKNYKAEIGLLKDEQLTFFYGNSEFDYCKKNFGAYVTSSILKRCKHFKLKAYLLLNNYNQALQMALVKENMVKIFTKDLKKNNYSIISSMNLKNFKKLG